MSSLPLLPGIGLKPEHYAPLLRRDPVGISLPYPAWVEVHPQNYFGAGGPPHRWLTAVAERYPLSFHSVGLSLGSSGGLIEDEIEALARLCDRYAPAQVSEHLSWSGTTDDRYPDLLPLALTRFLDDGRLENIADVIAKIAGDWPAARWDELMPWNWQPDNQTIAEAA